MATTNPFDALVQGGSQGNGKRNNRNKRKGRADGEKGQSPAAAAAAAPAAPAAAKPSPEATKEPSVPKPVEAQDSEWKSREKAKKAPSAVPTGGKKEARERKYEDAVKEMEEAVMLANQGSKGAKLSLIRRWITSLRDFESNPRRTVAVDADGNDLNFVELLLSSSCLERFLEGYANNPVEADTEMVTIFRHTLEGNEMLHRKVLASLNNVSRAFGTGQAPASVVSSLVESICTLKANAKTRGVAKTSINSQDRKIADKLSYYTSIAEDQWDHKAHISSDLVDLAKKKVSTIMEVYSSSGSGDGSQKLGAFSNLAGSLQRERFEVEQRFKEKLESSQVLDGKMKQSAQSEHEKLRAAEQKLAMIENKKEQLESRKKEIQAMLAKLNGEIAEADREVAGAKKEVATVKSKFDEMTKPFMEENMLVNKELEEEQLRRDSLSALESFVGDLRDGLLQAASDRSSSAGNSIHSAVEQMLGYVDVNLTVQDGRLDLCKRKMQFCTEKLRSMDGEVKMLESLGLDDMVKDANRGRERFERMYERALKTWKDAAGEVEAVRNAVKDVIPESMLYNFREQVGKIQELQAKIGQHNKTMLDLLNANSAQSQAQQQAPANAFMGMSISTAPQPHQQMMGARNGVGMMSAGMPSFGNFSNF
eukprot:CAMPEP_0113877656 /NCGR_PEP_ID=MMETSP0780_2-20120614/6224_1 /TAXON_ID=652834 /ORGANISM="Palpitomonas bilix" /LENGTH=649 /DNA_ID=CAMNT_0000863991 /DNA_START=65 /DNA_END=2014 /DNA_ORIENTATION=- /assembly_acc=CAM_ASM_000599